jgi:hypothetical protein
MGKKQRPRAEREIYDKPDYAADWFRPEPKPEKAKDESQLRVEDRLSESTVGKLAALKAAMGAESQESKAKQVPEKSARRTGSHHGQPAEPVDDGVKSFAELFDPVDEEHESFEELLNQSKLDWRAFKE